MCTNSLTSVFLKVLELPVNLYKIAKLALLLILVLIKFSHSFQMMNKQFTFLRSNDVLNQYACLTSPLSFKRDKHQLLCKLFEPFFATYSKKTVCYDSPTLRTCLQTHKSSILFVTQAHNFVVIGNMFVQVLTNKQKYAKPSGYSFCNLPWFWEANKQTNKVSIFHLSNQQGGILSSPIQTV